LNSRKLQAIQQREELDKEGEIQRLKTQAEDAKKIAESFKSEIASANERAASAQEQAAKFNEIAERERLARLKLEEKLSPRTFTLGQEQSVIETLRLFAGTNVDLIKIGDSAEITTFTGKIASILTSAGWHVRGIWTTMGGISGTGVSVSTANGAGAEIGKSANALVSAFREAEIASGTVDSFQGNDPPGGGVIGPPTWGNNIAPIRVYVGEKP
jgi:hypothetical protein